MRWGCSGQGRCQFGDTRLPRIHAANSDRARWANDAVVGPARRQELALLRRQGHIALALEDGIAPLADGAVPGRRLRSKRCARARVGADPSHTATFSRCTASTRALEDGEYDPVEEAKGRGGSSLSSVVCPLVRAQTEDCGQSAQNRFSCRRTDTAELEHQPERNSQTAKSGDRRHNLGCRGGAARAIWKKRNQSMASAFCTRTIPVHRANGTRNQEDRT